MERHSFSPNGLRAILFDLDGTLRHDHPTFYQAFFDIAIRIGVPDSAENRRRAMRWLHYYWAESPELQADEAAFGERDALFWTNHARLNLIAFGCHAEQADALAADVYRFMAEEYQPEDCVFPGVPDMLATLREAGFALGVASNRTQPYGEQLAKLGLRNYFDIVLAAGEINSFKPDSQIFLHAVRGLGARPDQTMYVGDNYFADVVGAQAAGLHPVLIDPDGLFPEAKCPVIDGVGELVRWLK